MELSHWWSGGCVYFEFAEWVRLRAEAWHASREVLDNGIARGGWVEEYLAGKSLEIKLFLLVLAEAAVWSLVAMPRARGACPAARASDTDSGSEAALSVVSPSDDETIRKRLPYV